MNGREEQGTSWEKWEWGVVIALLALGLSLRLQKIDNKLLDHHSFRQATEAMMARNFHRDGVFLQYPKTNGYSQWPRITINEFPLYPATVAWTYRFFAEHEILGRIVTIFFSLSTGILVLLTLKTSFRNTAPLWAFGFFVFSPLGAYVGRCFLRHPMAFFFQALGLYLWILWLKKTSWTLWFGVFIATSITVLMNFPNVYIGIPMLGALILYRGWRGLLDRRAAILAFVCLLPPVLWLIHSVKFGAWFLASDAVGVKQRDVGRFLGGEWLNASFFSNLWEGHWDLLLTPVGLILSVFGLLLFWRSKLTWIVRFWAGAVLLMFSVDHYPIYINRHEYYFLHALLPAAMAGGIAAGALLSWSAKLWPKHPGLAEGLCTAILIASYLWFWQSRHFPLMEQYLTTEYDQIAHWADAGKKVQEITEPDAVLVVDQPEDALIYYCDRPGWVNRHENLREDQWQLSGGGDYLLLTTYKVEKVGDGWEFHGYAFDDEEGGSPAAPYIRAHCPVIYEGSTFQIIDLKPNGLEERRILSNSQR